MPTRFRVHRKYNRWDHWGFVVADTPEQAYAVAIARAEHIGRGWVPIASIVDAEKISISEQASMDEHLPDALDISHRLSTEEHQALLEKMRTDGEEAAARYMRLFRDNEHRDAVLRHAKAKRQEQMRDAGGQTYHEQLGYGRTHGS